MKKRKKTIPQLYQTATKGVQNYAANTRKNVSSNQVAFQNRSSNANVYKATNPFPNPLKATSYQKRLKKVKPKMGVDNKLKGSYGETLIQKGKPPVIRINVKKHKGNKAELADTIKHELLHAKHPNMKEKTVYKKTKGEMSPSEQAQMLAKLRTKKINYKVGAAKRRFKINRSEKMAPGSLIKKANEARVLSQRKPSSGKHMSLQGLAIRGLV